MERNYLKIYTDGSAQRVTDITADDVFAHSEGAVRLFEITNPDEPTECVGGGQWHPVTDAAYHRR